MTDNNWYPNRLLETSGNYWAACIIHAAVNLDLFTVLGDQDLDAAELAAELQVKEHGLLALLNALAALQLISKQDGRFANTDSSRTYLSQASPQYLGYIIRHHHHLMGAWQGLTDAIRSGNTPVQSRERRNTDPEWLESFLMGMFNLASALAPGVAESIDLSDRDYLLDLGGGPGTYAIYFCKQNPQLRASVFDLPGSRPFAEKTIRRFNLAERINFIAGDFLKNDIEGSFDAIWISHILHSADPETCQLILDRAVSTMRPGATIMVHDFILDNNMDGPLYPALFSLNMLLNTTGGRSYSEGQIMELLSRAGVKDLQRHPFVGPNQSGIIIGSID